MKTPKIILSAGAITAFSLGLAFGQTGQTTTGSSSTTQQESSQRTGSSQAEVDPQRTPPQRTPAEIGLGNPGRTNTSPTERVEPLTREERLRQQGLTEDGQVRTTPQLEEVERQIERTRERLEEQQSRRETPGAIGEERSAGSGIQSPGATTPGTEFGARPEDRARSSTGQTTTGNSTGSSTTGPIFPNAGAPTDSSIDSGAGAVGDPMSQPSTPGTSPRADVPETARDRATEFESNRTAPARTPGVPPQREASRPLEGSEADAARDRSLREFGTRQSNETRGTTDATRDAGERSTTDSSATDSGTSSRGTSSSGGSSSSSGSSGSGGTSSGGSSGSSGSGGGSSSGGSSGGSGGSSGS